MSDGETVFLDRDSYSPDEPRLVVGPWSKRRGYFLEIQGDAGGVVELDRETTEGLRDHLVKALAETTS